MVCGHLNLPLLVPDGKEVTEDPLGRVGGTDEDTWSEETGWGKIPTDGRNPPRPLESLCCEWT